MEESGLAQGYLGLAAHLLGEVVLKADGLLNAKRPKVPEACIRFELIKRRGSRVDRLFAVSLGFSKVSKISPLNAFVCGVVSFPAAASLSNSHFTRRSFLFNRRCAGAVRVTSRSPVTIDSFSRFTRRWIVR